MKWMNEGLNHQIIIRMIIIFVCMDTHGKHNTNVPRGERRNEKRKMRREREKRWRMKWIQLNNRLKESKNTYMLFDSINSLSFSLILFVILFVILATPSFHSFLKHKVKLMSIFHTEKMNEIEARERENLLMIIRVQVHLSLSLLFLSSPFSLNSFNFL